MSTRCCFFFRAQPAEKKNTKNRKNTKNNTTMPGPSCKLAAPGCTPGEGQGPEPVRRPFPVRAGPPHPLGAKGGPSER